MGIVLAAPTFAVPESAPWTGFLVETAEDAALKAVGEGPDANAQSTYNDQASNTQTNLEQAFLNDVLASGYLDPKYFSKAGPLYQPPPDSAFKKDSHGQTIEPKQFDFDSQGYKDWARSGQNLQEFLNTNVITPFRAQFPARGASF